MKTLYIYICLFVVPFPLIAQHQLTNFGNMRIHNGASVTVFGNFKNDGTFSDSGTVVNFKGTANQVISGSSVSTFRNCTINNSSGVTLQQNINIDNVITLQQGSLYLQNNTLTVNNGSTAAIAVVSGNIVSEQTDNSGKIAWMINNTTGDHVYPFATASGQYIPFKFNLTGGNIGTVTLATYPTAPTNLPFPSNPDVVTHVNNSLGADNSANTVDRFWQIEKDGVDGVATITFTATAAEVGSIVNLSAYRWNSVSEGWETPGGTQTNTTTSVTVQNVVNFSPWTLAGNSSPLPVELLDFQAVLNTQRQVDLDWITASEINNDYFTIEKTTDGIHFEFVGMLDGAGNSNTEQLYHTIDPDPYDGYSYYRLKQTDYDGSEKYSELRSIYIDGFSNVSVGLYPNPSEGEFFIQVSGMSERFAWVRILDISGKLCYARQVWIGSDNYTLPVNDITDLSSGIYTVQLSDEQYSITSKLILK